jgi:hypothetical protein
MHRQSRLYWLALSFVLAVGTKALAGDPTFRTIDVPDALGTEPKSINDCGDIVGRYRGQDGRLAYGFLLSRGEKFYPIDCPDAVNTLPLANNNQGDIVGMCRVAGTLHGFLRREDRLTMLDFPGSTATAVGGITPRGDNIVGGYCDDTNTPCLLYGLFNHGFLWSEGQFTTIDLPDAIVSMAIKINSRGAIVGTHLDTSEAAHGFLLSDGEFTSIDFPGAADTEVWGINDRGDLVGAYCLEPCDPLYAAGKQGFVLRGSQFTSIDFPGAQFTEAMAINGDGDIVGFYIDVAGVQHGFLMSEGDGKVGDDEDCDKD